MPDSVFRKTSASDSVGSQLSGAGRMSLGSLLNFRRLTRKFTMSYFTKKKMSSTRSINFQDMIKYEPTYRMEPTKRIPFREIQIGVEALINNRIKSIQYDSRKAALISQVLSDDIKNEVKSFSIDRYKLVVHTVIGSKSLQEVSCTGKSFWDCKSDNYLTFNQENSSMFVFVVVYFVYHE